jgi:hypothetical protein
MSFCIELQLNHKTVFKVLLSFTTSLKPGLNEKESRPVSVAVDGSGNNKSDQSLKSAARNLS